MSDDQDDLFEAGGKRRKSPDLLHELDSIKGLLDDELHTASAVDNGEIPVLSEVVTAATPAAPTAPTPAPPAAPARRSPPPRTTPLRVRRRGGSRGACSPTARGPTNGA